ncbi:MAG: DUF2189 domain-containing protein [Pseudomonadota bacterium]
MTETDPLSAKRQPIDRDKLPFVAPCRIVSVAAPLGWLRKGLADLRRAPRESLLYGLVMAGMLGVVALAARTFGTHWSMVAMIGGFVFLAPLACVGLYAISAQLEREQDVSLVRSLRAAFKRHLGYEMVFAIVLLVIFMVWARSGMILIAFFPTVGEPSLDTLAPLLGVGTVVGGFFAIVTFTASAFSLPMIMHRDVDTVTAIVTSVNAVLRNKAAMLLWMSIIVAGLVIGLFTAFIGLIVIVPVLGYGAWHGYLDTIDSSAFPRHSVGITSVPRPTRGSRNNNSEDPGHSAVS